MSNVESQRGLEKFIDSGYIYVFDKFSSEGRIKFWCCERKGRCQAHLHTADGADPNGEDADRVLKNDWAFTATIMVPHSFKFKRL
jgi:hypothetical protein